MTAPSVTTSQDLLLTVSIHDAPASPGAAAEVVG